MKTLFTFLSIIFIFFSYHHLVAEEGIDFCTSSELFLINEQSGKLFFIEKVTQQGEGFADARRISMCPSLQNKLENATYYLPFIFQSEEFITVKNKNVSLKNESIRIFRILGRFSYKSRIYESKAQTKFGPYIYPHEIIGYHAYLWETAISRFVDRYFSENKKFTIIFFNDTIQFYNDKADIGLQLKKEIQKGKRCELTYKTYRSICDMKNRIKKTYTLAERSNFNSENIKYKSDSILSQKLERLLKQDSLPFSDVEDKKLSKLYGDYYADKIEYNKIQEFKREEVGIPILCIDPKKHSTREDKNDWSIECYINVKNGDFYQYFSFSQEKYYRHPFFIRDWALDYLGGVNICKKSTVGIPANEKTKIIIRNVEKVFNPKNILLALNEKNKSWQPVSPPEDIQSLPKERLFYPKYDGMIFGSTCKVWELDIWQRVGYMLKKHPEGIYLVGYGTLLQAEETQSVEEEHAFIQKHGVLITPELYTALEYLRQTQKEKE